MKNFVQQALVLAGFVYILSFALSFFDNPIVDLLKSVTAILMIVLLIILIFKKDLFFISAFINRNPKISLYLKVLGFMEYLAFVLLIVPGFIYGYQAAMAEYNGQEYTSFIPVFCVLCTIALGILTIVLLIWATYQNFIKKKTS